MRTPNLTLIGALPSPYALTTIYSAAVTQRASDPAVAQMLIDLLTAPDQAGRRAQAGFLPLG